MTDILARATKALEGVADGEWHLYRDEEGDAIAVSAWGKGPNGGHVAWALAQMPVPSKRLTREQINANSRFIAFARTGVPELVEEVRRLREAQTPWVPRVGDPIEVVPDFKYGEWVGVPLWCAGVQWDFVTLCHNVTVSDAWPPRHFGDYTDGFYINRAGEADDLRPRALLPEVTP